MCQIDVGQLDAALYFKIRGYASYLDASHISSFMKERHADCCYPQVIFDLLECQKMDSTFMGLMASLACSGEDAGKVSVARCSSEAFRCLDDLGLTQIIMVSEKGEDPRMSFHALTCQDDKAETERLIRKGHETLSRINESNKRRFEGVIKALEQEQANKTGRSS